MEAAFTFQPASPIDVDSVWQLYSETTRPHIEPLLKSGWIDPDQRIAFLTWWKAEHTLLVSSGGKTIGWISFHRKDGRLTLEHICVAPGYQSKGIGSAAINFVLANHRNGEVPVTISPLKGSPLIAHLEEMGFVRDSNYTDDALTITLVLS